MNFIVIMCDTLRPDYLESYGNLTFSPTSKKFAEQAAVFDNAWTGSFPTVPNRTDLFTGRYGEPFHPILPLSYSAVTLPGILRCNGYATQLICDNPHLISLGCNFDYPFHAWDFIRGQEVYRYILDHTRTKLPFGEKRWSHVEKDAHVLQMLQNSRDWKEEADWPTYRTYQAAIKWLRRNYKREKFFLWIDGFDPHEPALPPPGYEEMYDPGYDGIRYCMPAYQSKLNEAEVNNFIARYKGTVTFLDRCVGNMLDTVTELGLDDNTCIVWISDHGTQLTEHGRLLMKNPLYNESLKTTLMIKAPGLPSAGKRFKELVQPCDFAPTLLEMAGLTPPDCMQGTSYLPLLSGNEWTTGREISMSCGHKLNLKCGEGISIVAHDKTWMLIDYSDPSKRCLYNLENDYQQEHNLIQDFPEVAEYLHEAVLNHLQKYDAQPQLIRKFKTNDAGNMIGYRRCPPGYEDFKFYWKNPTDWEHVYLTYEES